MDFFAKYYNDFLEPYPGVQLSRNVTETLRGSCRFSFAMPCVKLYRVAPDCICSERLGVVAQAQKTRFKLKADFSSLG